MVHFSSPRLGRRTYFRGALSLCLLLILCGVTLCVQQTTPDAHAATVDPHQQYNEFWALNNFGDFQGWTNNGVAAYPAPFGSRVQLDPHANLTCAASDIDGGATSYDAQTKLCSGRDPMAAGTYNGGMNYYNGGSFSYGTFVSPVHTTTNPVTTIIASWDATTQDGTWMEVHVRILERGQWTHWYDLPIWASDFSTIQRHSVDGQFDKTGGVATDTFYAQTVATAYQIGITLFTTKPGVSPVIHHFGVIADYDAPNSTHVPDIAPDTSTWGINLAVPQRSQNLDQYRNLGYGGGGDVWCSPTSTSMVMAYWSTILHQQNLTQTVPDAAKGTYDFTYQGTGNWPNNTAYASEFGNIHAFVTRMYSLSQIEQWVKLGVPIVISIAFGPGQLPGATYSTQGHLMVVRGFTSKGDVIANDPAMGGTTSDAGVEIVYPRAIFQQLWLNASNGTVYVIAPEFWPTPITDRDGSW
ncbi:C39 family peptidase [Dictyobacter formicarum]|uniref:Peptidase C39-like domain-containing protein n=1 Tax=Dictyobacter formicarum TaxID=2778368 RepID=A0ABQ3VIW6_9CHLR|nr:C39 family peptidase [Dictyobacter formicarum]GHO85753.1 hypothetical protein KSZ_37590 [Dictyobacter formicarum]